jgi:glutamate racemase
VIERVAARIAGAPVPVVDSAQATADALLRYVDEERLARHPAPRSPRNLELLVTDLPASFEVVAARFLSEPLPAVTQIDL